MVSDGLGHGPEASKAAESVAEAFDRDRSASPSQFLNAAHQKATGTRGAAVAIAQLEMSSGRFRYAGIGNISGILANRDELKGLPSQNGTVGMAVRKPQETEYAWPQGGLLIMHSDGIQTRWSFKDYPGLQCRHPSIVAGVLARDFKRDRDDRTVLVAKLGNYDSD
jgi:serine phosphatase RsbU (regulator of sigma subunit)